MQELELVYRHTTECLIWRVSTTTECLKEYIIDAYSHMHVTTRSIFACRVGYYRFLLAQVDILLTYAPQLVCVCVCVSVDRLYLCDPSIDTCTLEMAGNMAEESFCDKVPAFKLELQLARCSAKNQYYRILYRRCSVYLLRD